MSCSYPKSSNFNNAKYYATSCSKKKIIKGVVLYSNCSYVENAVVTLSIKKLCCSCEEFKLYTIGYTETDSFGEFCFVLDTSKYPATEYFLKVFNPLNTSCSDNCINIC